METVPCPISNSKAFTPFIQVPDRFDVSGKAAWQLVRSTASGLIMLNPRPQSSEASVHYRNGEYDPFRHGGKSNTISDKAYLAARTLLLGYRTKIILKGALKPLNRLSLLEIGCSTGDLLNYLHQKKRVPKENLAGVEPDHESRAWGQKQHGLKICHSIEQMREIEYTGKKFDRIVLWHTLEHMHALNESITRAKELLDLKGVLVLALPNPLSWDALHYRENWIAWDAPRHLYHFTPDTLEKLFERHNLQIVKHQPYLPDSLYNTLHSEKLRCTREGKRFTVLLMGSAVLKAGVAAAIGVLWPLKASSLVYFVRSKNKG
jgi:2-polyprenyl-3-methyl-5-hydroxy-6-metoxy-1,4-benzoquinol methylase